MAYLRLLPSELSESLNFWESSSLYIFVEKCLHKKITLVALTVTHPRNRILSNTISNPGTLTLPSEGPFHYYIFQMRWLLFSCCSGAPTLDLLCCVEITSMGCSYANHSRVAIPHGILKSNTMLLAAGCCVGWYEKSVNNDKLEVSNEKCLHWMRKNLKRGRIRKAKAKKQLACPLLLLLLPVLCSLQL